MNEVTNILTLINVTLLCIVILLYLILREVRK